MSFNPLLLKLSQAGLMQPPAQAKPLQMAPIKPLGTAGSPNTPSLGNPTPKPVSFSGFKGAGVDFTKLAAALLVVGEDPAGYLQKIAEDNS